MHQPDARRPADARARTEQPAQDGQREGVTALLARLRSATGQGDGGRGTEGDAQRQRVSLGEVVDALGSQSFGPLVLLLGLIIISPIGDIPGVSALMALAVMLVALQVLVHRGCPWLPAWLLRRSVRSDRVERALGWLEKPARFADRHLHPRLRVLTGRSGSYLIAAGCFLAAVLLVPLEFVPGASTLVGTALIAFGLALVTHDGLAALLAFVFIASAVGMIAWQLL